VGLLLLLLLLLILHLKKTYAAKYQEDNDTI